MLEELVEYGPEVPTAVELLQLLSETRQELSQANQKLKLCRFGLERYSNDKDKLKFYVGFVDYKVLVKFFDWLQASSTKYGISIQPKSSSSYCRSTAGISVIRRVFFSFVSVTCWATC